MFVGCSCRVAKPIFVCLPSRHIGERLWGVRRICTWLHGVERQVQLVRLKACLCIHCIGGRNVTLPSAPGCVALGARYSWCAARQASLNSMFSVVSDGSDSGHRRSSKRPQCAVDMWMRIWNTWPCATPKHPPQQSAGRALGRGSGVLSGCRNDLHNVACPGLYCRPPQQTSRASLPGRSCMSMLRHRTQHLPA